MVILKNILSQQIVIILINSTEGKLFKTTYNKMESGIEGAPDGLSEISGVRRFHRCKALVIQIFQNAFVKCSSVFYSHTSNSYLQQWFCYSGILASSDEVQA